MDFSFVQIELIVPTTLRVVDVKDANKDVLEHVVAPQVVQGDGSPQVEEATEERAKLFITF